VIDRWSTGKKERYYENHYSQSVEYWKAGALRQTPKLLWILSIQLLMELFNTIQQQLRVPAGLV
jgi:hypothetical protein